MTSMIVNQTVFCFFTFLTDGDFIGVSFSFGLHEFYSNNLEISYKKRIRFHVFLPIIATVIFQRYFLCFCFTTFSISGRFSAGICFIRIVQLDLSMPCLLLCYLIFSCYNYLYYFCMFKLTKCEKK